MNSSLPKKVKSNKIQKRVKVRILLIYIIFKYLLNQSTKNPVQKNINIKGRNFKFTKKSNLLNNSNDTNPINRINKIIKKENNQMSNKINNNNKKDLMKFEHENINNGNKNNISYLLNGINNNEIYLKKIKNIQSWWKNIFKIIKIQKYIRGFLYRIGLLKNLNFSNKIIFGIINLIKFIKKIIYKNIILRISEFIKYENQNKTIKTSSLQRNKLMNKNLNRSIELRRNHDLNKIFYSSNKIEKQKPKIKLMNCLTKRKNIANNINKNIKLDKRENIKVKINKQNNKIDFIDRSYKYNNCSKKDNTCKNNQSNKKNLSGKVNKLEISHKIIKKSKNIIKYRDENDKNMNKYKSYYPDTNTNKTIKNKQKNSSQRKDSKELEYISSYNFTRLNRPIKAMNLNNNPKPDANPIKVKKRKNENNNIEINNNSRPKSLENRTNRKYKSFNNYINKYNNSSGKKEKNSSIIKENKHDNMNINKNLNINKTSKNKNIFNHNKKENKYKKEMVTWLNVWKQSNNRKPIMNRLRGLFFLKNIILSYMAKNYYVIFFDKFKKYQKLNLIKIYFNKYKKAIFAKRILEGIKIYQKNKIILKKLLLSKETFVLKKYFNIWKNLENYYIIKSRNFVINNISNISEYFNKSQPEINNFDIIKNKYNFSNINPNEERNNINININYNLITNNNNLNQKIYKKKKINVPNKNSQYLERSCMLNEEKLNINLIDSDINDINEEDDFVNYSMITRRIKLKKENKNYNDIINKIYVPKHIKQKNKGNETDYVTYDNKMHNNNNENNMVNYKGVINKRINLIFKKNS